MSKYVKITPGYALNEKQIEGVVEYGGRKIIKKVREMRKDGAIEDMTCGKKINTVIFLLNGKAILTNVGYETILKRWDEEEK